MNTEGFVFCVTPGVNDDLHLLYYKAQMRADSRSIYGSIAHVSLLPTPLASQFEMLSLFLGEGYRHHCWETIRKASTPILDLARRRQNSPPLSPLRFPLSTPSLFPFFHMLI